MYGTLYLKQQSIDTYIKNKKTLYDLSKTRYSFYLNEGNPKLNLQCPVCKQISKDKQNYIRHSYLHDWTLFCPYCNERRDDHLTLDFHIVTKHLKQKQFNLYKCKICKFVARDIRGLARHFKEVHLKV